MRLGWMVILVLGCEAGAATPSTQPATQTATATQAVTSPGVDAGLRQRLVAVDERIGRIADLTADFEQSKQAAMLKKPLVSSGTIKVKGSKVRWDTHRPAATVMTIDAREVRMYYPRQKTLEIYAVQQRLAQLAASPLPRLAVLEEYFSIEAIEPSELGEQDKSGRFLALKLTPRQAELSKHLKQVLALLDVETACIVRLETTDADDEKTVIRFSNVHVNRGLSDQDLELVVPEGTTISRPLAELENPGGARQ